MNDRMSDERLDNLDGWLNGEAQDKYCNVGLMKEAIDALKAEREAIERVKALAHLMERSLHADNRVYAQKILAALEQEDE